MHNRRHWEKKTKYTNNTQGNEVSSHDCEPSEYEYNSRNHDHFSCFKCPLMMFCFFCELLKMDKMIYAVKQEEKSKNDMNESFNRHIIFPL